jgi:hypothetical protein
MSSRPSHYLRHQAEACIALSRATIDLAVAGRLRAMAEDFRATAAEWDKEGAEYPSHGTRSESFAGRRNG